MPPGLPQVKMREKWAPQCPQLPKNRKYGAFTINFNKVNPFHASSKHLNSCSQNSICLSSKLLPQHIAALKSTTKEKYGPSSPGNHVKRA